MKHRQVGPELLEHEAKLSHLIGQVQMVLFPLDPKGCACLSDLMAVVQVFDGSVESDRDEQAVFA